MEYIIMEEFNLFPPLVNNGYYNKNLKDTENLSQ